ncbi:MAG: HD domain-containing protein [Peptococcaceae bacterium]|nr:HD domain-containing protein [Peptococcaceae bacterium]
MDNAVFSISFGYATKYTERDYMQEVLAEAENYMYKRKIYESASMRNKTIDVIMNALFEKSEREMLHSKRVSVISAAIASALGFPNHEINKIRMSGLVHDIGKIGIDEKVFNKPGKLDESEWMEMRKHPEAGWRILSSANDLLEMLLIEKVYSSNQDLKLGRFYKKLHVERCNIEKEKINSII